MNRKHHPTVDEADRVGVDDATRHLYDARGSIVSLLERTDKLMPPDLAKDAKAVKLLIESAARHLERAYEREWGVKQWP